MGKTVKILIALFIVAVIGVGGVIYIATTKINPEEIRKIAISAAEDALPGANVDIATIDYSLGTSIRLFVKGVKLNLKKGNANLANVDEVEIKIPILSLLTTGGKVDIQVRKPNLSFIEYSKVDTNWSKALPKEGSKVVEKTTNSDSEDKESDSNDSSSKKLPAFITKSKINIKFSDINFEYKALSAPASMINISKVHIRDLNLESTTPFEVISNIDYNVSAEQNIKLNLKVFGEIDIAKFLKEKTVETSIMVDLNNIKVTGVDIKIPNVKTKVFVVLNEKGEITADVKTNAENILDFSTKASVYPDKIAISKLKIKVNFAAAGAILPNEIKKSLEVIDLGKSALEIKGDVLLVPETSTLSSSIEFGIKNPIKVTQEGVTIATTMAGEFKNNQFSLDVQSKMLEGLIRTTVNTNVDLINFDPNVLPKVFVNVDGSNIRVEKKFIQKIIWGGKKSKKEEEAAKKAAEAKKKGPPPVGEPVNLPQVDFKMSFNQVFIADEELKLDSRILVGGQTIKSEKFDFNFGKGNGKLSFKTFMKDSVNINNIFSFNMKTLNFNAFNGFLPPDLGGLSGIFNGKIHGSLNLLPVDMKYDIKVDKMTAVNGGLSDFQKADMIWPKIQEMQAKVPLGITKEMVKNPRFKKLAVQVRATHEKIKVDKFDFLGDTLPLDITRTSGDVYMSDKKTSKINTRISSTLLSVKNDMNNLICQDYLLIPCEGSGLVPLPKTGAILSFISNNLGTCQAKKIAADAKKKGAAVKKVLQKKAAAEKKKLKKKMNKKAEKEKKKLKNKAEKELKNLIKF